MTRFEVKAAFEKAKIRDNYSCVECKTKKNICIHHIDGTGDWGQYLNSNNSLSNLMTLCRSCHTKIHWKARKLEGNNNLIG